MDEILSTLNSTSNINQGTSSVLDPDFSLAMELSRRLEFSSDPTTTSTPSNTSYYNSSSSTNNPNETEESSSDDEDSDDEASNKKRPGHQKRDSDPLVEAIIARRKEVTQKISLVENWVAAVNPTDGENNVLDRMKDRHRVEARALVTPSATPSLQSYVPPEDDRYYRDEWGYDRHDRYDGPRDRDDYRDDYRHPLPPPGARDPRILGPGGFVEDRDDYRVPPRDPRDPRNNGLVPDYREDYRYGPRQAGPRGQYIDERDRPPHDDRFIQDDSRGRGPNAPPTRHKHPEGYLGRRESTNSGRPIAPNNDNMHGSRKQNGSSGGRSLNGDEVPLGRKYRTPSSSHSSSSASSATSSKDGSQHNNKTIKNEHLIRTALSHKTSFSSKNGGSSTKEKYRDESSSKPTTKSNSTHSRQSSFSSGPVGHGSAVGNESPLRQEFRHDRRAKNGSENGPSHSRRSSISENDDYLDNERSLRDNEHTFRESFDEEDRKPLGHVHKQNNGTSSRREIMDNERNNSSRRSSDQESDDDSPLASPTGTNSNNRFKSQKERKRTGKHQIASSVSESGSDEGSDRDSDNEPINLPNNGQLRSQGGNIPPLMRQDYYGGGINGGFRPDSHDSRTGPPPRYGPNGYREEPMNRYPLGRDDLPNGRYPPGSRDDLLPPPGRYPPGREEPVVRYAGEPEEFPVGGRFPPPPPGGYRDDPNARHRDEPPAPYDPRSAPYPTYREEPPYEAPRGRFAAPRSLPLIEQPPPELSMGSKKVPLIEMAGYRYDQNKRAPIQTNGQTNQPFLANMSSRIRSPSPMRYGDAPAPTPPSGMNRGYPPRERGNYPIQDKLAFLPQERGREFPPPPPQDRVRDFPPERGYGGPAPPIRGYNTPANIRGGKPGYEGQYYNDRRGREVYGDRNGYNGYDDY
ncbi:2930_t:CDS:2 [Ambispora gerdemannii]|uniref:2930_t:CDS:1 n=1 Tax=Ambispora gerdemannii TaxID=144530 RepID=A0A9N8YN63_9GLOM|nr:2930_t:CDS:2 [Ambispora gerdemannii]